MFFKIISLKTRIFLRSLKGVSFVEVIAILCIFTLLTFAYYEICDKSPQRYYLIGCFCLLLLLVHSKRKDYFFCQKLFLRPYLFFSGEYLLFGIPLMIIPLVKNPHPLYSLYGLLPFIAAAIPLQNNRSKQRAWKIHISMPDLDTTSLFRRYGLIICALLLISMILTPTPGISVALVYLLVLFSGSAFSQSENLALLCLKELPARLFLNSIIRKQILFWGILTFPILLVYALSHFETAFHILFPLVLCPLQITANVSAKYKSYQPNKDFSGSLSRALCMLGFIIPVFFPVSVILTFVFYHRAIENLNIYLYAYD